MKTYREFWIYEPIASGRGRVNIAKKEKSKSLDFNHLRLPPSHVIDIQALKDANERIKELEKSELSLLYRLDCVTVSSELVRADEKIQALEKKLATAKQALETIYDKNETDKRDAKTQLHECRAAAEQALAEIEGKK